MVLRAGRTATPGSARQAGRRIRDDRPQPGDATALADHVMRQRTGRANVDVAGCREPEGSPPPGSLRGQGRLKRDVVQIGLLPRVVEGLERAGRHLDREKLIEVAETFDGWDENVYVVPLSYGPDLRGGMVTRLFFSRADLENERLVRVSDDILFEMPQL